MDVKVPSSATALALAAVLLVSSAEGSGTGISVAGDAVTTSSTTDTLFFPYRPKVTGTQSRYTRDLEFQLSSRYSIGRGDATPGRIGSDNLTLINFGATLTDSIGKNPFNAPYSDLHLGYDYFSRTGQQYDPNPFNPVGFTLPISDGSYPTVDKAHVDFYIFEPGQTQALNFRGSGSAPSFFTTPKEDSSTGHWSSPTNFTVLPKNSAMGVGPSRAALADVGGTGWTRPGQAANWTFTHEFQHLVSGGSASTGNALEELFSAGAEVLTGDLPSDAAAFDYAYTWSLLVNDNVGLGGVRSAGANYAGRRLLAAYLLYNYRNQDTTATLNVGSTVGGFADDLFYRWARESLRTFGSLQGLLSNASCYTCSLRPSLSPGGQPLSDYDRLQLVIHQMRVASFVNNPFLAADASGYGPYGYPPRFGFSPAADVGAWRDIDPNGPNVVAIPQEVTARPGWVSRDTVLSKDRSRDGVSYPLVLQPYGSEYWVIRSTSGISAGTDLMVRVESDSIFRTSTLLGLYCLPLGKLDARLMATVVGYTQQSDSLWAHPEYAGTVLDTRWVDVDSLAGEFVFSLPNFGTQYRAAVLTLTLGDGPSFGLNAASSFNTYQEAVHYRLNLGLRKSPPAGSDPAALVESSVTEDYPAWSPNGTEIAYESADAPNSRIMRKPVAGGAATVLVSASNSQHTPDWSPRGDRVAFAEDAAGGNRHIRSYNLTTQVATDLTTGTVSDLYPVFQPNGERLAYVRTIPGSGQWTIRRVNVDGSNDAAILTTALSTAIVSPRWTPNGQAVYFVSNSRLYSVPVSGGTATPQDSLGRDIATFDLPRGSGRLLIENAASLRWICDDANAPAFMPYRRIALRDTLASPKDTEMRWYRTGASFWSPRYSFDNTRIAYRSDQNAASGGDLYIGQAVYDHAPTFVSTVTDTTVGMGIGLSLSLAANDPDGDALTYSGAYFPAGASLIGNLFSWPSPDTTGGPVSVVLRALSPGGALASKVVKITVVPRPVAVATLVADAGRTTAAAAWSEPNQPQGQATSYELRYLINTTITENNFSTGTVVSQSEVPGPAGTPHCVLIPGIASCKNLSIAVRTWRNGIPSTISNVASASTACSGSLEVSCGDFGLWGGGGGGGFLRAGGTRTASTSGSPGSAVSNATSASENSILGDVHGTSRADLLRLPTPIEPDHGEYAIHVRRNDGRTMDLDQVALLAVDHADGEAAIASNDGVLIGTCAGVASIRDLLGQVGSDAAGQLSDGGIVLGRENALTIELDDREPSSVLVIDCVAPAAEVVRDSAGVAVQIPTGDGDWGTIDLVRPRAAADRRAVDLRGSHSARLVALGKYTILRVQRLAGSSRANPAVLSMLRANHSVDGDVAPALRTEDSKVAAIRAGEAVQFAFEASPPAVGKVRELFLQASGSTESSRLSEVVPQGSASLATKSFVNALGIARPNPTADRVTLAYSLGARSEVRLSIYDVAGRLVKIVVHEDQEPGPHEAEWDGRSTAGVNAGPGVYFYRLVLAGWRSEKKLVVLRR